MERGGELVAADEPAVVAETFFDTVVVEDGESDKRLADSTRTNESEWSQVFRQTDEIPDQLISSK